MKGLEEEQGEKEMSRVGEVWARGWESLQKPDTLRCSAVNSTGPGRPRLLSKVLTNGLGGRPMWPLPTLHGFWPGPGHTPTAF